MMRWWTSFALVLLVGGSVAMGSGLTQAATAQLTQAYPEVQFYRDGTQLSRVWGTAFGYGLSPEHSAETFVETYGGMYGVTADELGVGNNFNDQLTLPLMYDPESGQYKFTLVYYRQYKDGVPVFGAELRLLVRNEPGFPLVLAASSLHDLSDFVVPADLVRSPAYKVATDAALKDVPTLTNFTDSELVVWAGTDDKPATPKLALTFVADNHGSPAATRPEVYRFVMDASTGEILHKENRIVFTDVTGNVSGMATSGPKSDQCDPEVPTPMKYAKVTIGSTTAYADADGNFTIPNGGSAPVTVQSPVAGHYFIVTNNGSGGPDTLSPLVTPPGPVNIMHNQANTSEYVRSQTNAYVQSNVVRDWMLTYAPNYPTISTQVNFPVYVNRSDGYCPGNAWYDPSGSGSLNLCSSSSSYPNTAYSSVVLHEYGHHAVEMGGSGQDQYGEGTGDSFSVLILDDHVLGYGFLLDCNTGIRDAQNSMQYPCTSDIHTCAQLLSGCIWSTRNELIQTNPNTYLSILSNLMINSIPLHTGGTITRQIYTDFITLDGGPNGPHHTEITNGFAAHNMVPLPPPANDLCANAIVACPGQAYTGNTSGASRDGVASCGSSNSTPDVWYKYTPATNGNATFSLCGSGTTYDSVLALFTGICPGTSQIGCDDDGCGGSSAPSTITASVTAGTTYLIRVSGWNNSTGAYSLTITGPACQSTNYTLTTNVTGQGSIGLNPPGGTYPSGTVVTVTANAAAGWHFDHWTGDLSGSTNPTTITMNGNKSITAVFVQDQYTLTVTVAGQGTVGLDPPGGTYPSGTIVTVTANPVQRWHFDHWAGDLTGRVNPTTIQMGGNHGITVVFGLTGDMNCDGVVNFGDINPFVLAIGGEAGYLAQYPNCLWRNADADGDGDVNFGDINPFVAILQQP